MKSLAFWYEPTSYIKSADKAELQLHLNHWKVKEEGKKYFDYFLDFGIRIKAGGNVKNICFYLPEVITNANIAIEDLGANLRDSRLLTAIFNENYSAKTVGNKKHFEVILEGITQFYVYSLDVSSDCRIVNDYGGTIFTIPFVSFKVVDNYYRFRIKCNLVRNFSHI